MCSFYFQSPEENPYSSSEERPEDDGSSKSSDEQDEGYSTDGSSSEKEELMMLAEIIDFFESKWMANPQVRESNFKQQCINFTATLLDWPENIIRAYFEQATPNV